MDVYFYEAFEEEGSLIQNLLCGKLLFDLTDKTIQESGHVIPPARLISVRTQSMIPIDWQDKLDAILSRTTGFDNLEAYKKAVKTPLALGYLEEYATRAVAEQAILLMLALMRRLPQQIQQFKHFQRDGLTGVEALGKNLLVVGVGRIGSEIVKIGQGLGLNVKGVDIVKRHNFVSYVDRDAGLSWADIIICAMNLTDENVHYFSYNLLKKARSGVIFINIARGEHAPLYDLFRLVQEGHLGGLALDVFDDEPTIATALRTDQARQSEKARIIIDLLAYPNVILTPHNAFNTAEALQRKVQFSLDEIFYFLEHHQFRHQV